MMKHFFMKRRNWGLTLLGLWLILSGLMPLGLNSTFLGQFLPILAVAAGVLILLER
jgi:hypothetical protein